MQTVAQILFGQAFVMQKHQSTIKEIAAALNVSISTVSRALQNDPRIGLRTTSRVQEMAKAMHYTPNQAAVLLRKGRTMTIGLMLPWLREEFFSLAITGIEDVLIANGYHAIISQSRDQMEREKTGIKSFIGSRVDGVIASISADTCDYQHFESLHEAGIPIVFFDRVPQQMTCHQVRSDVISGVEQALCYLSEKGIRKIALLNGPATLGITKERLEGFQLAAQALHLPVRLDYIKNSNLTSEDTKQKASELVNMNDRPEAIFTFNDYVALDAMQKCRQMGLSINKDIYFVSFANLSVMDYMEHVPIASVEQFPYEMGERAAQMLLNILHDDLETAEWKQEIIPTRLVLHETLSEIKTVK
jgi:DNA-binding LacI/PurR family transcriptional regulator